MATSRRKFDFDIVIVGSGMVGTCLAALLAREGALSGWKIALVDPVPPRKPDDHGPPPARAHLGVLLRRGHVERRPVGSEL